MKNNNLKKNKLIEYFSKDGYINKIRNLFNEIEKQKFLKKCKILIEKKKNVKKNVLSLKNPYEDISISLHKMKNEFINNNSIYLFTENNKENNNIENPLTLLFGYYITETYFNYADQFINFIYGENEEKKIEKERESITMLNIDNYIFINKFFLFELISKEKHKISKKKTFYKNIRVNKTTKREKKISNLIAFKKETKVAKIKKQIYNFKRLSNKLDDFSLLEKKDNLIRYKMKFEKSINNDLLEKRKLFKRLSYVICFDKDDSFNKLFEEYQDFINLEDTDEKKNTLLILSVKFNNFKVFKFLIEKGANINTQNIYLNTPLHYAFANKHYKFVDYLINKGADENIENIHGQKYFESENLE